MIEEKTKLIDFDRHHIFTNIRGNDEKWIITVSSLNAHNEYTVKNQPKLMAECFAFAYAVNECIDLNTDATIFVSPVMYAYFQGYTILEHWELLTGFLERCYKALNEHTLRMTYETVDGVKVFKLKRVKVSITETDLMKQIKTLKYDKDFIFKNTEHDKLLRK